MTVPVPDVRHSLHAVVTAEPLQVEASTTLPLPEAALLRRFGADTAQIDEVTRRPHVTVLHRSGSVADAPRDAVAARLEALTIAVQHDGRVLDLAVPRLVTHDAGATDPQVATQWVALDLDGADVLSHGLSTFGLPELRSRGAAGEQLPATLAVLTGLAHRLLAEWPGNDPVGLATVTLADVARGLGQPEAEGHAGVEVDIAFDHDELAVTFLADPQSLFD